MTEPSVFDAESALQLNHARMWHLESLQLDLGMKTVLDAGCGVGHLVPYFLQRGGVVTAIDARWENVIKVRDRFQYLPTVTTYRVNVDGDFQFLRYQDVDPTTVQPFEVTLCYGLLYHLENPHRGLRNLANVTTELLLVETMVTDSTRPILTLDPENNGNINQSVGEFGNRPSPTWCVAVLRSLGFQVYGPREQPNHVDFRWTEQGNGEWFREGHPLRRVFIASRKELQNPNLERLGGLGS